MTKIGKILTFMTVVVVAIIAFVIIQNQNKQVVEEVNTDPKNSIYILEGSSVSLINGTAEVESAPGSASKTTTKYFGNEAKGDLNADGKADTAFILTQSTGGSGVFYYVTAFLSNQNGYAGTNSILLGDRIAPQTTVVIDGQIIVNYADRKPGEPMTTSPSMGVSKYFKIENGMLVEVPVVDPIDTSAWKTKTSGGVTFKYPESLGTKYITAVDFPPKVQVLTTAFACTVAGVSTAQAGATTKETIGGNEYCVTLEAEGAAGSTYTSYAYAWARNGGTTILTFTTRAPQCENYDDPKKTECKTERANFDIGLIADAMARSLTQ